VVLAADEADADVLERVAGDGALLHRFGGAPLDCGDEAAGDRRPR